MKSFLDLIKDGMISSQTIGNLTIEGVIWALIMSFIAGFIIYLVYKYSFSGVMFVNNFAITLVGLTMITCLIILTITSNLLLSLGMVGALSIVRFRTAVKEPIDMIYMFWSIATGVAIGAGFFMLASIGIIFISAVLYLMSKFSNKTDLYILVVRFEADTSTGEIEKTISKTCKKYKFRAEIQSDAGNEATYEIRFVKNSNRVVSMLTESKSIKEVSLVSYNTNTLM